MGGAEGAGGVSNCDDCKHRTGWRTAFVTTGREKMVVADCVHPDWPEWWKTRNERPIVSPGAGSACKKYERHERHNAPAAKIPPAPLANLAKAQTAYRAGGGCKGCGSLVLAVHEAGCPTSAADLY